jgi:hypothetical protein
VTRATAIILVLAIIAVALVSGNGNAMPRALETGVARSVGY